MTTFKTSATRPLSAPLLAAALLGVCLALTGCGGRDKGAVKTQPLSAAAQIQQIQNDPHMPPEAKASAIQALQQSQARGAASGQATGQKAPH
jgi:outer membrane murein-binding lipoprotein Lpp